MINKSLSSLFFILLVGQFFPIIIGQLNQQTYLRNDNIQFDLAKYSSYFSSLETTLLQANFTNGFLISNNGIPNSLSNNIFSTNIQDYSSELLNLTLFYYPINMKINEYQFTNNQFKLNSSFQCNNQVIANTVWTSLLVSKPISINCNSFIWKFQSCSDGSFSFCVNCSSSCNQVSSQNQTLNNLNAKFLTFDITSYPISWPSYTFNISSVESQNVTISYNIQDLGSIYCGALSSSTILSSPLTISSVTESAYSQITSKRYLKGSLVIPNLQPSTNYTIMCYTESWQNVPTIIYRSSLSSILENSLVIKTKPLSSPMFTVSVPFNSLVTGLLSQQISIQLNYRVANALVVYPILTYISSSQCGLNSTNNLNQQETTLTPKTLIYPAYTDFSQLLFMTLNQVGCYQLKMQYSEVASELYKEYSISIIQGGVRYNSSYVYINSYEQPVAPKISLISAQFKNLGVEVHVYFDHDTDEGGSLIYRNNFPCNLFFNFTSVEQSQCRFSSPNFLRILPPTTSSVLLLTPNDRITLLPKKLKPACPVSDTSSCNFDYLPTMQVIVTIDTDSNPVTPTLISPTRLNIGSNLTLDITTSMGNGGRAWSTFSWTVSVNNSNNVVSRSISKYLNNNLTWFDCLTGSFYCDTLPPDMISIPGIYTFRLKLTNFLNISASTSRSVQVLNKEYLPLVKIINPSTSTILSNYSNTFRTSISLLHSCPSSLDIYWLIFKNNHIDNKIMNLIKGNRDVRSLTIPANELEPENEYRIRVMVFCETEYSYDEVTRYIILSDISPLINDGTSTQLTLANPLTFKATLSDPMLSSYTKLFYRWSCVDLSTSIEHGCINFYQYLSINYNESSSVIYLSNPDQIFSYSSIYLIQCLVYSNTSYFSSGFVSTQLTPMSASIQLSPQLIVSVPSFNLVGEFGYMINATVSFNESFVVVWEQATTNATLSSRFFLNGGVQYAPIFVQTSDVSSRVSYSFRLSAFIPIDDCYELNCIDSSYVTSSLFSVGVNLPPSHGNLIITPTSGDEQTIFSLSANNWIEEDLPLSYTFYRSDILNTTYHLIRQRMIINSMNASFVVLDTIVTEPNVFVKATISDYYGAGSDIYSTVTVTPSMNRIANYSLVIDNALTANEIVLKQLNPEILLSSMNSLLFILAHDTNLTCSEAFLTFDPQNYPLCEEIILTTLVSFVNSMSKFNPNYVILTGLIEYFNTLLTSSVNYQYNNSLYQTILSIYSYLYQQSVLLSQSKSCFTSPYLQEMLSIVDHILHMQRYQGLNAVNTTSTTINSTIDTNWLIQSGNMLASLYQPCIMIDSKMMLVSDLTNFHVALTRQYLFINNSMNNTMNDAIMIDSNIRISSHLFPGNLTTLYNYLTMNSSISREICSAINHTSCHNISQSIYVDLTFYGNNINSIYSPEYDDEQHIYELQLNFTNVDNDPLLDYVEVMPQETVQYEYTCSELQTNPLLTIVCTENMTGGPNYTFPYFQCPLSTPLNQTVVFTCPLYSTHINCLQDTEVISIGTLITNQTNKLIQCSYPVHGLTQTSATTTKHRHLSTKTFQPDVLLQYQASFSYSIHYDLLTESSIHLPTMNSETRKIINYVALAFLLFSAIIFGVYLTTRTKDLMARRPVTGPLLIPQLPVYRLHLRSDAETESCRSANETEMSMDVIDTASTIDQITLPEEV